MGATLTITAGFDGSWSFPLLDADGQPTAYPEDATFDAKVWRGDDEAPLFEPVASWLDAGSDTVRLAISAGQTATLDPGTYRLQVGITSGSVRSLAFDGTLEVTAAPGSGATLKAFGPADDLLRYYPHADMVQPLDSGRAGFLEQRSGARDAMIRFWVEGYRPRGGFVKRRGAWDPIISSHDRPDPTLPPPTRKQLEAWLEGDRLIIDEKVRKVASFLALAILFQGQETGDPNTYRVEAEQLREAAMDILHCLPIRIDTTDTPDGVADIEIRPGSVVIFLGLEDSP